MNNHPSAKVWATAESKNQDDGRVIIFRYVMHFHDSFDKATQPDRVIISWPYESPDQYGMMSSEEQQLMDMMEDAFDEVIEKDGFATLAMVSTGDGLREWIYYARSEDEFMERLNVALEGQPVLPIEIHAEHDPEWTTYESFRKDVKGAGEVI